MMYLLATVSNPPWGICAVPLSVCYWVKSLLPRYRHSLCMLDISPLGLKIFKTTLTVYDRLVSFLSFFLFFFLYQPYWGTSDIEHCVGFGWWLDTPICCQRVPTTAPANTDITSHVTISLLWWEYSWSTPPATCFLNNVFYWAEIHFNETYDVNFFFLCPKKPSSCKDTLSCFFQKLYSSSI